MKGETTMAKTTKITAKKIMDKNNGCWIAPTSYEYEGFTVEVKPFISFEEVAAEISALIKACAPEDGKAYYPEAIEFGFRLDMIALFTNIIIPEKVEEQYALVYGTEIYKKLANDREQIGELWNIVTAIVKYNTENLAHRLTKTISDLVAQFNEIANIGGLKEIFEGATNLNNTNKVDEEQAD